MFPTTEILPRDKAKQFALELGLNEREYDHIADELGRVPSKTELGLFAGMWSEHCSYKSTLHLLKTLPKESPHTLAGPGSHAGVVDVGEGWAVAFKIESHNHPSAVEPYEGAATGVGGILRDIIAQGARPCAVMDSLCFDKPNNPKTQHLVDGVVAGIAGYGNAFGVPNVGGRTNYDERYKGNPLVNALAAGLVRPDKMRTANASGIGNPVIYAGAATGRDGILGAAFASEELDEDNVDDRHHVQVGDPFAGKKLMEACIAFTEDQGLLACQDMGACGITCGAVEMAAAGNVGMDLDLDTIPLREAGMTPHEILLSESQERFLFVVTKGTEKKAIEHFASFGVAATICGHVVDGSNVHIRYHNETFVNVPAALVADGAPPANWPIAASLPAPRVYPEFEAPPNLKAVLSDLLSTPGIGSQEELHSHYDHTVGNRTVRAPGQAEAAVLKLPNSQRGFALTISSRGDLCANDPFLGTQATLAETSRNLACAGAEMIAITDGLNLASPRDPIENLKLAEVIRGLKEGLEALEVPVTGGNVSLYNESPLGPIPPTPMVGAIGTIDTITRVPTISLQNTQVLFLLGVPKGTPVGCHYGAMQSTQLEGQAPDVDLPAEKRLAKLLVTQSRQGLIMAAKDGGKGGLGVALAKLCIHGSCGADVTLPSCEGRPDWQLFGEYAATAWVSVAPENAQQFSENARTAGVPAHRAGIAGGKKLHIREFLEVSIEDLSQAYEQACNRQS